MSGRYSTHPSYQDSELSWLGHIPKSWALRRLGSYFRERRTKVSDAEFEALSVTMQGIVPQLETAAKTNDGDNRKLVRAGDFVINSRSDRKGSSGVSPYDGSVSLISIVLEPIGIHPPFVHHLLRSGAFQEEFYRFGKGIVADLWSTNYAAMKNIVIPVMPLSEQTQIAKFLDYETAKIDALIEKQQQLIDLLKEKRQAVISHAVTKGLSPNAPMRDSGVEWLGEVPAHWKIGALSYYATLNTGATPDRSKPSYWSGDIPWVKTGEVNYEPICKTEEQITEAGVRNSSVRISPPGTLLMAMYGQGVTRGRVAILAIPATYNQACVAITPGSAATSLYLRYFFMSAYHAIRDGGNLTSQMNLNLDIVKHFKIAIPTLDEQYRIVSWLDDELPKLNRILESSEVAIQLMMERRTALISAAVTGKIDVRNWKPPESEPKSEVA